jgi:hypothetical protein
MGKKEGGNTRITISALQAVIASNFIDLAHLGLKSRSDR